MESCKQKLNSKAATIVAISGCSFKHSNAIFNANLISPRLIVSKIDSKV